MYIVVTGAAGFIGANLVKALNERGQKNIIAVDNLTRADKFKNLVDCEIADYFDKQQFRQLLQAGEFDGRLSAILHQGACSDTMENNGQYMLDNNYRYSVELLEFCQAEAVPLIYASSASVYGSGRVFVEQRTHEAPLNVYGYSKFLFDQVVRQRWDDRSAQIVGLRYFNVYGDREQHKGRMASVAYHLFAQYQAQGVVKLFAGCDGYANGEQRRDFVSVEDVVKVNLFFLDHPKRAGIFNLGTGQAQSFNDVACATVNACRQAVGDVPLSLAELQAQGILTYIDFPAALQGKYQSFTQADIQALRQAGYNDAFYDVNTGTTRYIQQLLARLAAA